jgi:hypothetical protein
MLLTVVALRCRYRQAVGGILDDCLGRQHLDDPASELSRLGAAISREAVAEAAAAQSANPGLNVRISDPPSPDLRDHAGTAEQCRHHQRTVTETVGR